MLPKTKDPIEQAIIDILVARLRDDDLVRDAFQQVQVKLLTMPDATEKARYGVAQNVARAVRRWQARANARLRSLSSIDGSERELPDSSANPEEAVMGPEAVVFWYAVRIDRLLPRLNERQRHFLMLACEGLKMEELEKALGVGQSMAYAIRLNVIKAAQALVPDLDPDPDPEPGAPPGGGPSGQGGPSGSAMAAALAITRWSRLGTTKALLDAFLTLPAFADCTHSDVTGLSTKALALTESLLHHSSTALEVTSRCADAVVSRATGLLAALRSLPAFRDKGAQPRAAKHGDRVH